MIDRIVAACDIPALRVAGVEADDVLGTLARKAEAAGMDAVIVSGDKDLLQLVTPHVSVFDPYKDDTGKRYGCEEVRERYGAPPDHLVDVLALMGDTADNVPGVPGIGEKTARKLIEQYGTLEGLYDHLEELKGKQKERIETHREQAFLSRELVTIDTAVPLDTELEACRRAPLDRSKLAELFGELAFQSLLEEYLPDAAEEETLDYTLVVSEAQLEAAIDAMRSAGRFAVDTETTSVDPMRAALVGISLSCEAGTGYYIPVGHNEDALRLRDHPDDLFPREEITQLDKAHVLGRLKPLFEDPAFGKIGHNIKYDFIVFAREGVHLRGIVMDTMVASYLTDPSRVRHNLNEVSLQYLRRKTIPIAELIGKGSKALTFDTVPVDLACPYACEDADVAWRLAGVFEALLTERALAPLFDEVELPLIEVLARMEMAGIALDTEVFAALQKEIEGRLATLEAEIHRQAGGPFQINSPKQLQVVLFDTLGLKPLRKTKTGYSTDMEVLEQLARDHPVPALVLEYRSLDKLRGTYVEALPKLIHPETGRVHTSFNQAVTATGRLSSSDPNLQNIPVRTELGRRIRQGFVPGSAGHRLISADYSQIELRILAHMSGDPGLHEAFANDADVHRETAARAFHVPAGDVTPEMRRQAKAINFGVIYGISPFGLARNLGIPRAEAARFIDAYFAQFPKVQDWIEATLEAAREQGYVTTLFRRRRYVAQLESSDVNARKAAERAAINTPIQGTAADMIKIAMVRLDAPLAELDAQILLQVHDELIVETPAERAEAVAQTMRDVMENVTALDVPLKVDIGIGNHWAEIH